MLRVLPANISNLIAAGEVVSRPASVVKELMENAIDAGAGAISVFVTDAGRTLIRIVDNGCGMTADEAALCFERHATSKISTAEDLEKIVTYGFRGEALASIAAVAQVTLKTRRKGDELGTKVEAAESKVMSSEPVSTPEGTVFDIRNLFYNVPARRKFLKSDAVELRNIVQEFLRIALTRTGIALKLMSNGKELYNLRPATNLKQRIHDVYGMNFSNELVPVSVDTSIVRVSGFVGNPQDSLKRQGNQFFFVNGRYFRSALFNKAVCKPYEKLIPADYSPAYFIYLEMEPQMVDVNIHPAKTEVKFEDDGMIFEILTAAVRESLGKNDFTPSIDFDMQGAPQIPVFDIPSAGNMRVSTPKIDYEPLFNPFETPSFEQPATMPYDPPRQDSVLFDTPAPQFEGNLLIVHRKYIVTPVKSGMMLIHIERAWRRVFYERYYEKIAEDQPVTQQTLFPVTIKLSGEDCITLLEQPDLVQKFGFDIRDFGDNTVVVYGVPDGCPTSDEGVRRSVDNLIAGLSDNTSLADFRHIVAVKMAESAASSAAISVNQAEAQSLVDQLLVCRQPRLSPDGKPCAVILTLEELEKLL